MRETERAHLEVVASVASTERGFLHLHPINHVHEVDVRVAFLDSAVSRCPLDAVVVLHRSRDFAWGGGPE